MTDQTRIPDGFVLTRTTDVFDEQTVPAGLLRTHRVADGVWARLVVHDGHIQFVFEDRPEDQFVVGAGKSVAIPPARPHRVVLVGPARFEVEFYRPAEEQHDLAAGPESTGLT